MAHNANDVHKYESFINDVLKEDLRTLEITYNQLTNELGEFYETKTALTHCSKLEKKHETVFKSLTDVGCNFLMETEVNDVNKVVVHLGLEYYLEFPLTDAIKYIDARIKLLTERVDVVKKRIISTKSQIKMCVIGVGELQNLL